MSESGVLNTVADAVAILWDECQERPSLLRFLAPFGRPNLRSLEHTFRSAPSVEWIVCEPWPVHSPWLAAAVVRMKIAVPKTEEHLRCGFLGASAALSSKLYLEGGRSLVVSGDLTASEIAVEAGARLTVAGTLRCQTLVSEGLVLVQRDLVAETVAVASGQPHIDRARGAPRAIGWQIGQRVTARVLDSPRFGLACEVDCDAIIRLAGRPPDPLQVSRARSRVSKRVWDAETDGIDTQALMDTVLNSPSRGP